MSAPTCDCDYPLSQCALHEAAADLYAALKDLLHAFPGEYATPPPHIIGARYALAKAEGK